MACETGFYQPDLGAARQTACLPCPSHSTTISTAASLLQDCVCEPGYFNKNASGGVNCEGARNGMDTSTYGATLMGLPVKRGYYRPSALSVDLRVTRIEP